MSDIDLRAINLHWLEQSDPFEDCCLHGGVYLEIEDTILSDGRDSEWTVSTAAFNLLKTLSQNHDVGDQRPLIPHCGHTMWVHKGEPDDLYLGGCDIGIDWTIEHEPGKVLHKIRDQRVVETSSDEWRTAVCQFSDSVFEFFMTAWPKRISDKDDLKGFELFMNLWQEHRAKAENDASSSDN